MASGETLDKCCRRFRDDSGRRNQVRGIRRPGGIKTVLPLWLFW